MKSSGFSSLNLQGSKHYCGLITSHLPVAVKRGLIVMFCSVMELNEVFNDNLFKKFSIIVFGLYYYMIYRFLKPHALAIKIKEIAY